MHKIKLTYQAVILSLLSLSFLLFDSIASYADDKKDAYLPIEVGFGWELKDKIGTSTTVIREKKLHPKRKVYDVDWFDEFGHIYHSEYWIIGKDGVYVEAVREGDDRSVFEKPYLLVKYKMKPGDKWQSSITDSAPIICDANENCHEGSSTYLGVLETEVEKEEVINTALGALSATKVVMKAKQLRVERWYVQGVGIVKEITYRKDDTKYVETNHKEIVRNITGWRYALPRHRAVAKGEKTSRSWDEKDIQLFGYKHQDIITHSKHVTFDNFEIRKAHLIGTWRLENADCDGKGLVTFNADGTFHANFIKGRRVIMPATPPNSPTVQSSDLNLNRAESEAGRQSAGMPIFLCRIYKQHMKGAWSVKNNNLIWIYDTKKSEEDITPITDYEPELIRIDEMTGEHTTLKRIKRKTKH